MNKYKVLISKYFDTYHEWTKTYGTVESLKEAKKLEKQARTQYYSRPLVSYSIRIEKT